MFKVNITSANTRLIRRYGMTGDKSNPKQYERELSYALKAKELSPYIDTGADLSSPGKRGAVTRWHKEYREVYGAYGDAVKAYTPKDKKRKKTLQHITGLSARWKSYPVPLGRDKSKLRWAKDNKSFSIYHPGKGISERFVALPRRLVATGSGADYASFTRNNHKDGDRSYLLRLGNFFSRAPISGLDTLNQILKDYAEKYEDLDKFLFGYTAFNVPTDDVFDVKRARQTVTQLRKNAAKKRKTERLKKQYEQRKKIYYD